MGAFERISSLSLVAAVAGSVCTIISFQTFTGHIAEWRYDLLSVGFFLITVFPYLFLMSVTFFEKCPHRIRRRAAILLTFAHLMPMLTGFNMVKELIGSNDSNSPQQLILFGAFLILTIVLHVRYAAEFTER